MRGLDLLAELSVRLSQEDLQKRVSVSIPTRAKNIKISRYPDDTIFVEGVVPPPKEDPT
jgi:hypothetical protein